MPNYRFRLINEQFVKILLLLDKAQVEFGRVRFQDATFMNDNAELIKNLRIILERHINRLDFHSINFVLRMQYACSGLSATFEVHYKTCIGRSTSPAGMTARHHILGNSVWRPVSVLPARRL